MLVSQVNKADKMVQERKEAFTDFKSIKKDEGQDEAPACDLTDVPDCYIAGLDMALVQVASGTCSTYQQLLDHHTKEGTARQPRLLNSLCARRWKSQHVEAFAAGKRCVHYTGVLL